MNTTINPVTAHSSKISTATVLSDKNAGLDGENTDDMASSSLNKESFQNLIENAAEDISHDKDKTDNEAGGNVLPIVDDLVEPSAENGHNLSIINFSFSAHLAGQGSQLTQSTTIDSENELNALTAQVRQLLKSDLKVEGQQINAQLDPSTGSNVKLTHTVLDNTLLQSPDNTALTTEQLDSLTRKGLVFNNLTNQQQLLPAIQSSLLLQTVTPQTDFNTESLPVMLNVASTTTTMVNLQALPQAEIIESFARPGWTQGMGKQILMMVQQNISSAEIRLNPANLGPIEVRIEMSDDQVNVALSSRHAVVREAMEQALPKLREMFDDNGLNLASTDISQQSFAEQREQKTAGNHNHDFIDSTDQTIALTSTEVMSEPSSLPDGFVDYYI